MKPVFPIIYFIFFLFFCYQVNTKFFRRCDNSLPLIQKYSGQGKILSNKNYFIKSICDKEDTSLTYLVCKKSYAEFEIEEINNEQKDHKQFFKLKKTESDVAIFKGSFFKNENNVKMPDGLLIINGVIKNNKEDKKKGGFLYQENNGNIGILPYKRFKDIYLNNTSSEPNNWKLMGGKLKNAFWSWPLLIENKEISVSETINNKYYSKICIATTENQIILLMYGTTGSNANTVSNYQFADLIKKLHVKDKDVEEVEFALYLDSGSPSYFYLPGIKSCCPNCEGGHVNISGDPKGFIANLIHLKIKK